MTEETTGGSARRNGRTGKKVTAPAAAAPLPAPPTEGVREPLAEDRVGRALLELARAVTSCQSVADVQKAQLAILQALLMPRSAYVLQPGAREGAELHVATVRGRNDERITAVRPGEGAPGRAFQSGELVREDEAVALPVLGSAGVLGCIVLLAPRYGLSDALGLALGAQLGAAWELATVKDDAARRQKDLQTAVAGLKSLERNREELLSNVSHDLKNPLTTVKTYLAMLGQGKLGPLSEPQSHAVQVAERNADRLQKMVNDLLLLSRLQSGKMHLNERPFGLKALLADVLQALTSVADRAKVRLELARSPEVFVKGDRERLSEALHHLVEYSVHQTPAGDAVHLALQASDGLVSLSVRDGGPPLAPEQLEHLFDSFHRPRTAQGMRTADVGLSLPIVAKVAQLHGGKVEARSGSDRGCTLSVYLPVFAAAVAVGKTAVAPRAGGILLVEDDRDCREVLQEVLEAEGYSVMATALAHEAQSLLSESRPALVLLDLRLSHEDGRSVLHHVRSTPGLAETPVYIISGASEVGSLASGTGLDRIDGFFEKPLQLQRLLDTVASVVHPAPAPGHAPQVPPPTP